MKFKYEKHRPKKYIKRFPYAICVYCGLVYLKNPLTQFCIKFGCRHEDHPKFKSVRGKS